MAAKKPPAPETSAPDTETAEAPSLPLGAMIDGKPYSVADLTYGEQRDLREKLRESFGNPTATAADIEFGMYDDMDWIPAFVWLIRRRSSRAYQYEEALSMKPGDVKSLHQAYRDGELPPDWPAKAGSS